MGKVSDQMTCKELSGLTLRSYWVLDRLSDSSESRFTSTQVARYLIEECGIATSRQAVEYALKADKHAVHKDRRGYKLMAEGRQQLQNAATAPGVKVLDSASPFTAKSTSLREVIGDKYQSASICDPYLDVNTLDVIYKNFTKGVPIRLLTVVAKDKPQGTLARLLKDLCAEGFNLEIRVYNRSTLHDRYIITDTKFVLTGTSLNYLGNKESFLVTLGEDIRASMLATFNSHWKAAVPLPA